MRSVRRTSTGWLVAAVLALVAGTVGLARPAGAADGRCDGVWVVVDARALGGELTTRCAEGDPSSGLEALAATGHSYSFVPRQPGLVCTIDARPDPCNGAPADAYWGYYHAPAGGEWTYAVRGAGNRDPEPGSVEGWAFGDDAEPGRRPPTNEPDGAAEPTAAPASEPSPTSSPDPTSPRPSPSSSPSPTAAPGAPATAPSPATSSGSGEPSGAVSEPVPGSSPSPSRVGPEDPTTDPTATDGSTPQAGTPATPGPTDGASDEVVVATDAPRGTDTGSPVGLIAGGVLVAGIAGAGVVRSRRRDDGA